MAACRPSSRPLHDVVLPADLPCGSFLCVCFATLLSWANENTPHAHRPHTRTLELIRYAVHGELTLVELGHTVPRPRHPLKLCHCSSLCPFRRSRKASAAQRQILLPCSANCFPGCNTPVSSHVVTGRALEAEGEAQGRREPGNHEFSDGWQKTTGRLCLGATQSEQVFRREGESALARAREEDE